MVIDIYDVDEFEELVKQSRFVVVLVYNSREPGGRYLSGLLDDIAKSLEPVFAVAKLDAAEAPAAAARVAPSVPRLLFFIDGSRAWEQIGFFYSPQSDRYAIRRGLLMALRSRGYSPARIGVRLSF